MLPSASGIDFHLRRAAILPGLTGVVTRTSLLRRDAMSVPQLALPATSLLFRRLRERKGMRVTRTRRGDEDV
jgi:hypothetical protein